MLYEVVTRNIPKARGRPAREAGGGEVYSKIFRSPYFLDSGSIWCKVGLGYVDTYYAFASTFHIIPVQQY